MKKNPNLAAKLRKVGLSKIVDSSKVRRILDLPIHESQTGLNVNIPQWKKVDLLYQSLDIDNKVNTLELIDLLLKHQRTEEALEIALQLKNIHPGDIDCLFRLGSCYLDNDEKNFLIVCMEIDLLKKGDVGKYEPNLGMGQFYQDNGEWDKAYKAYQFQFQSLLKDPFFNDQKKAVRLCSRAALAAERAYEFEDAIKYYDLLKSLDRTSANQEKNALCHEKLYEWRKAAYLYEEIISDLDDDIKIQRISKKLSNCYYQLKQYEAACVVLFGAKSDLLERAKELGGTALSNKAINQFSSNTSFYWLEKTKKSFADEDWLKTIEFAKQALYRNESHSETIYDYLSLAYAVNNEWEKAAKAISVSTLFSTAYGINLSRYKDKNLTTAATIYAEYRKYHDVNSKIVLFESYHGQNISCHPLAIFSEMKRDSQFNDYTFVWAVKEDIDNQQFDFIVPSKDVIIVKIGTDLYNYHLATAEYLINNVTFPTYFTTRTKQKYLNTWHGIPIKHLGKDVESGTLAHANVARNILQATHLISPNEWYFANFKKINDVDVMYSGKDAILGSPRFDRTFEISQNQSAINQLKSKLGLQIDVPVVMYAPTWRGMHGNADSDLTIAKNVLDTLSEISDVQIIFKPHQFLENNEDLKNLSVIIPDLRFDTSELLAIADILISDYSSIVFDYLPVGKPLLFHIPDYKDYKEYRGLYFEPDSLPGLVSYDRKQLKSNITNAISEIHNSFTTDKLSAFYYNQSLVNDSSNRAIQYFFNDDETYVVENIAAQNITAIYNGMYPNGITSSLFNLLSSTSEGENLVIVTDNHGLKEHHGRFDQINKFSQKNIVIGRVGIHAFTAEERWLYQTFINNNRFSSNHAVISMKNAFRLEFQRIFGNAKITKMIDFEGMSPFWAALIGAQNINTAIWQHSDILSEMKARFSNLVGVFQQYKNFDKVVSISPSITELNKRNLSLQYVINPDKFTTVLNQISKSQTPIYELNQDITNWLNNDSFTYLFVGRLSIEKNLELLIEAFALVEKETDAQLLIVGEGTSKKSLIDLTRKIGLTKKIMFTGHINNPTWLYKKSDAFVMSSSHEGMPMVILEALMSNKPVIATDLPGIRDTLEPINGYLSNHNKNDLASKMLDVAQNGSKQLSFDSEEYYASALMQYKNLFS